MTRGSSTSARTGHARTAAPAGELYLAKAIARYAPEVAAVALEALGKLSTRYPGARRLVYDRRGSLPIGLAAASGGAPVFSIVLYRRWVRLFFLEGVTIDDPERRLEGSGNLVRSIRLDAGAAILDHPYIRRLMAQAVRNAGADLKSGSGEIVVKSTLRA